MTRTKFWINFGIIAFYFAVLTIAVLSLSTDDEAAKRIKNAFPLLILLPAAWLAECFRRRAAYLSEVKSLYKEVVDDFQTAIRYTRFDTPTDLQFYDTRQKLASSIDKIRGHFANFSSPSGNEKGLYPIEGLKVAFDWIDYLGGGDTWRGEEAASLTRDALLQNWNEKIRDPLLYEIDRIQLSKKLSPYLNEHPWHHPPNTND